MHTEQNMADVQAFWTWELQISRSVSAVSLFVQSPSLSQTNIDASICL